VFLPGDHALYSAVSGEVRSILDRYTPLVEPLSLDEAFLDVTGARRLFGPGRVIGARIRDDVADELDLTCSVGVAPNKFLAKLASVDAKPRPLADGVVPGRGVVEIEPGAERKYLDALPVGRLWGVGPATLDRLHRIGVVRVADLRAIDRAALAAALGVRQAAHLLALAEGRDERPVEPEQEAKSIGHEQTYSTDLHTPAEVRSELVRLADAVAARLRRAGVGARTLTLKLRFSEGFHTITRSTTAVARIDDAAAIVELLAPLLEALDPTPGVRLLGVSGSNLGEVHHQLSFDELDGPEHGSRDAALDEIRERFGRDAIGPASSVRGGRVRTVSRGAQQWGPEER
jgi:DNA polymerase-4